MAHYELRRRWTYFGHLKAFSLDSLGVGYLPGADTVHGHNLGEEQCPTRLVPRLLRHERPICRPGRRDRGRRQTLDSVDSPLDNNLTASPISPDAARSGVSCLHTLDDPRFPPDHGLDAPFDDSHRPHKLLRWPSCEEQIPLGHEMACHHVSSAHVHEFRFESGADLLGCDAPSVEPAASGRVDGAEDLPLYVHLLLP